MELFSRLKIDSIFRNSTIFGRPKIILLNSLERCRASALRESTPPPKALESECTSRLYHEQPYLDPAPPMESPMGSTCGELLVRFVYSWGRVPVSGTLGCPAGACGRRGYSRIVIIVIIIIMIIISISIVIVAITPSSSATTSSLLIYILTNSLKSRRPGINTTVCVV